jgi:hypothetical protein
MVPTTFQQLRSSRSIYRIMQGPLLNGCFPFIWKDMLVTETSTDAYRDNAAPSVTSGVSLSIEEGELRILFFGCRPDTRLSAPLRGRRRFEQVNTEGRRHRFWNRRDWQVEHRRILLF